MTKIIIEIPNFVRKLQVSKKQKAKYFEWNGTSIKAKGTNIPVKFYRDKKHDRVRTYLSDLKDEFVLGFFLNGKPKLQSIILSDNDLPKIVQGGKYILGTLIDNKFEPVIANSKKVGTPRFYLIKGQDIYSGNLREHFKGFVMTEIKKCYKPYIVNIPVIEEYPIKIECELHDTIKNPYHNINDELGGHWDLDNYMYPYLKAFPDILVEMKKLKDDDRLHLTQTIGVKFIPIKNHDDRKLVFIISKDDRVELEEIKTLHKKDDVVLTINNEQVSYNKEQQGAFLKALAEDTENLFNKTDKPF